MSDEVHIGGLRVIIHPRSLVKGAKGCIAYVGEHHCTRCGTHATKYKLAHGVRTFRLCAQHEKMRKNQW